MDPGPNPLWERGRSRWPLLALTEEQFAARVDPEASPAHAEDVFLAIACLAGVDGAAREFCSEHGAAITGFTRTIVREAAAAEELASQLMVELLVGDAGAARLAGYTGRGPLRAWLRMTAVRRALNSRRDGNRRAELQAQMLEAAVSSASDPEAAYLKQRYGAAVKAAFRDAFATLEQASALLLRLHFGEEVNLSALGAMYGWSKATASRRVAAARDELLRRTSELVAQRLSLDETELSSLFRVVSSDLDVSLSGLFTPGQASVAR